VKIPKEGSMSQALLFGLIGAVLGGGMGVLIATAEDREGPIFIASNEAVTEAQVRNKLQSEGWTDIRIMQQGLYLEATGSQDGRAKRIMINSASGRLIADDSDDDWMWRSEFDRVELRYQGTRT